MDENQDLGDSLTQSFQLGTCVRDELRVTQGSWPAAVTCESRCLETKSANIILYCYKCVKCELWFPTIDPGMSLVMFKGRHPMLLTLVAHMVSEEVSETLFPYSAHFAFPRLYF